MTFFGSTKATHPAAFQTVPLLLHLFSHDPMFLRYCDALGFLCRSQEVSIFPGESGTREGASRPVAPAGGAWGYSGADSWTSETSDELQLRLWSLLPLFIFLHIYSYKQKLINSWNYVSLGVIDRPFSWEAPSEKCLEGRVSGIWTQLV